MTRFAVAIALIALAIWFWRGTLLMLLFVATLGFGALAIEFWKQQRVLREFRRQRASRGKDLLIVYSNSPHWQAYIEQHWMPRWGARAVFLNWSERSQWAGTELEVRLFRAFAPEREYNPLAIVVPAKGARPHVVRFWRAFRDFKHGRPHALRRAEDQVDQLLEPR